MSSLKPLPLTEPTPKPDATAKTVEPPVPSVRPHRNPNRIRDHLANERTYLAWMRSGISLLGFGVLIVRIRVLRPPLAPHAPGFG